MLSAKSAPQEPTPPCLFALTSHEKHEADKRVERRSRATTFECEFFLTRFARVFARKYYRRQTPKRHHT